MGKARKSHEEDDSSGVDAYDNLSLEDLRQERIKREREYLTSPEGYLDFIRQCGAAPDATYEPHGKYANDLVTWNGAPDPGLPSRILYKWKLVLWPRGSFKSQAFDVGLVAWMVARNPDIRILVTSETNRQAKAFVQEAMKIVDSEWFRERFGVHRGRDWRIGSGSFISAQRTRKGIKDPTVRAAGVGEVQTGSHWDLVIMDDICSQENTRTPEAIESLWHWFGETLAQLDPGCKLFMIGTLHHYSDIYCRIMKEPKIRAKFEIFKFGWCDPLQDPEQPLKPGAKLFFPERLTQQYVAEQKIMMPPRLFACFYENRPATGEQQIFKPDYFHVIPDHEMPRHVWTYILTDFAFVAEEKKTSRADQTVMWVVSLDANRIAYVHDVVIGRYKPSDAAKILCSLWDYYQRYNVKGVIIEKTAYQEVLSNFIEMVRRETMIRPRLIEIGGRNQETKDLRIEAMEPRWRRGEIYFLHKFRAKNKEWKTLFDEMIEWPFSTHDDIPDAISDLDKKDKDGKLYCPGPPPGWYSQPIAPVHKPSIVDGRFSQGAGWDPRKVARNTQDKDELWRPTRNQDHTARPQRVRDDVFKKRMPPPPR